MGLHTRVSHVGAKLFPLEYRRSHREVQHVRFFLTLKHELELNELADDSSFQDEKQSINVAPFCFFQR